ncbi:DUF2059 domain-containing protein [Glaciimonas soli]|uniref:DUF2059 domain-containing protein n=1 Tax=Glaciimonas soli TaxID=2590999 RepID=A0A843YZ21_9BURK|nr:DUF2059 domain-containing protein [Glaciimonas soli]MQR01776.1 DUF2059 domain-containing protein [Glaciimonas soli]
MKKIAISIVTTFALILSVPGFAQTPATTSVTSAAAPIDPATAQAVRNLLEVMKFKQLMANTFSQAIKTMPETMRKMSIEQINGNAKLTLTQKQAELAKAEKTIPEVTDKLNALFNDPAMYDEMAQAMIPLYARHFSADEIDQITAFYKTGVGAKMLTIMPQLTSESMQISQQIMMPRINKLIASYAQSTGK